MGSMVFEQDQSLWVSVHNILIARVLQPMLDAVLRDSHFRKEVTCCCPLAMKSMNDGHISYYSSFEGN